MSSLYEENPTYSHTLPTNLASQSSDYAKALFGIILQWQEDTGSTTLQQFMSCVGSTLKHHTTVHMGEVGRYFGAIIVWHCSDCVDPDGKRLPIRPWTPTERFELLSCYVDWLIRVKAREELDDLILRLSEITDLGRTTEQYCQFERKLRNAVDLLDKDGTASPKAKRKRQLHDDIQQSVKRRRTGGKGRH
ncbi:hypothetical protein BT96DRAFT_949671 [Gymnopus androsaceus JB14]|uniref:Uncharacterized protein n=1 Tax=Gymnopus androsaceus JB14 TaxID=1447944 RepID=A0A6A4GJ49_9AGAR|nr:hypothetical protein BT96DRAFT_949671 [Gymnopus androsaceus JB14]